MWQDMIWVGLLMGGVVFVTQAWAYRKGYVHWQRMVFIVLRLLQTSNVLALRSERAWFFQLGPGLITLSGLGALVNRGCRSAN